MKQTIGAILLVVFFVWVYAMTTNPPQIEASDPARVAGQLTGIALSLGLGYLGWHLVRKKRP